MFWLVGGTSESVTLAQQLTEKGYTWIATVATTQAIKLYQRLSGQVLAGRLNSNTVHEFMEYYAIQGVIDASHPFASEISNLAIQAAQTRQIPYYRFERDRVDFNSEASNLTLLPTLLDVLSEQYLKDQRVLLTVGVKALPLFQPWRSVSNLWARVLPSSAVLAQEHGFSQEQLILSRGPMSLDTEVKLWQNLQITSVVTKASGIAGGLTVKLKAAQQLGTHLIVIDRPSIHYPFKANNLQTILDEYTKLSVVESD